jgi:hypothetical protein
MKPHAMLTLTPLISRRNSIVFIPSIILTTLDGFTTAESPSRNVDYTTPHVMQVPVPSLSTSIAVTLLKG